MGVVASVTSVFSFGLQTGGSAAIIWGWIISSFFTFIVAYSMAEICGAFPTAGSVYHWAGQVVPPYWTPFVSYVCGWCNFVGNVAGDASFAYVCAVIITAILSMVYNIDLEAGYRVAVSIGVLSLWAIINILRVDRFGWFCVMAAALQIATVILIVAVVILFGSRFNDAEYVFTSYHNDSGFSSSSYVLAISILTSLYSFSGYEASAHMAEETSGARLNAPRGIIYTCYATAVTGFGMLLALLFVTTDIKQALDSSSGNAAIQVLHDSLGQTWAVILTAILAANTFFSGMSSVAVTSRITFALVRDNAFPFSDFLSYVHPVLQTPIPAIVFLFVVDAALLCLPVQDPAATAFISITGITTIGFQLSYAIPILMKLVFRDLPFPVTPLSLGQWSVPCAVISCVWLMGTSVLFFLPTSNPVNASSMNWTVVVIGGFFLVGALNWILYSQFRFHGPKRFNWVNHDAIGTLARYRAFTMNST